MLVHCLSTTSRGFQSRSNFWLWGTPRTGNVGIAFARFPTRPGSGNQHAARAAEYCHVASLRSLRCQGSQGLCERRIRQTNARLPPRFLQKHPPKSSLLVGFHFHARILCRVSGLAPAFCFGLALREAPSIPRGWQGGAQRGRRTPGANKGPRGNRQRGALDAEGHSSSIAGLTRKILQQAHHDEGAFDIFEFRKSGVGRFFHGMSTPHVPILGLTDPLCTAQTIRVLGESHHVARYHMTVFGSWVVDVSWNLPEANVWRV